MEVTSFVDKPEAKELRGLSTEVLKTLRIMMTGDIIDRGRQAVVKSRGKRCRLMAVALSVEGGKLKINPKMENGKLECSSPTCGCEKKFFHHSTGGKAEPADSVFMMSTWRVDWNMGSGVRLVCFQP